MLTGAQPSLCYSVVNPSPAMGQQLTLSTACSRQESQLPYHRADTQSLLDHQEPGSNVLMPAPAFSDAASSSVMMTSSEDGTAQDTGVCIVCGFMQNNLATHMAGHSKEDMIMALMSKSRVTPFQTALNQPLALNNQLPATSRSYSTPFSFSAPNSSSSLSFSNRDGGYQQTSDNAAVAAAALLHLGGNLSDGASRVPLNIQEAKSEFSAVSIANSTTSSASSQGNASTQHVQPPPDYHQHHHTRFMSQSVSSNPQESYPNYGNSYLVATPQNQDIQGNNPTLYSTNQCYSSVQAIQYASQVSVHNSIPISAPQGSDQGNMPGIISVASHSPLIMMPNNVTGQVQEMPLGCAEINIPIPRQDPVQVGTLAVRPRYQLVQPSPQLQATVTRGSGIPVIARPSVPVKYLVLNNNASKFLSPLASNVHLNNSYFVDNSGSFASVQVPSGSTTNVQLPQVNQVSGVVQSQSNSANLLNTSKISQQCTQGTSYVSQVEPQLSTRALLHPSSNLSELPTSDPNCNSACAIRADPNFSDAPCDAKVTTGPSALSGHSSASGASDSAAPQEKAVTTVHVGNNITIFVPKDMVDKKERLQQIINEELVRGILLNDSKEVTVESSTCSEVKSCDSASSKPSESHCDEPGPSRVTTKTKDNRMKVELFQDFWSDESSLDNDCDEQAVDHEKSVTNATSAMNDLPNNTTPQTTESGAHNTCVDTTKTSVQTSRWEGASGSSTDLSNVKPQEKIFLKDTGTNGDDCTEESHSDDKSLASSDPLSLLNIECPNASEKGAAVPCSDANNHQVLPHTDFNSSCEETSVTSFNNFLKQDNSDSLGGAESKEQHRPFDSPFTSGSSSFRVMSLGDVHSRDDSHISQLEVKVKQDEAFMEEERVLFSPSSMLSSSSSSSEGAPHEEDLSLRTAETLADSDSEPSASRASCLSGVDEEDRETPTSGIAGPFYQHENPCLTDPASALHLTMDATESLATSEVLLANLSSEESGSLPPHPHELSPPLLRQTSPKQYRRASRRSHSSLSSVSSSSADSLSSCNSPMDLRNAAFQRKGISDFASTVPATSSHAVADVFAHHASAGDSIFGPPFTSFGYPSSSHAVVSSTCSKQSDYLTTSVSSYVPLNPVSKREPHFQEDAASLEVAATSTDAHQPHNLQCKSESSGKDATNAGVVLNIDSCTVLPQTNFSQWFPTSTSSSLNQRPPSLNHQPEVSAGNGEASTSLCFSNSDILRNISSYLSPRDSGTGAASQFEEDNGVLGSLDTSLNLGAEFALPYDDVGLVVASPSRSPCKNESPKKVHHSPRVTMSSPQPSTSGLNKRPFLAGGSGSTQEIEYEFDYDSDCYADSDCELQAHGSSTLPLEQWKCHQCNKMFKSLKEKLLHAGKHSPSCVGPMYSSVSSWHRAVPGSAVKVVVDESKDIKSVTVESAEDVKLFPAVKREDVKAEPALGSNSVQPEAGAALGERLAESDLNMKKLKTLEACRTDNVFKCPECLAQFPCADDLLNHRKKVLNSSTFCPLCHLEFKNRNVRSNHVKTTHSVRQYNCALCYMSYKTLCNWRKHQLMHLGIVPFECNRCGKCFIRRFEFLQHERVHTGEKPFGCGQCSKTFGNESNLRRHIFTHSDDQLIKCETCDKSYKNARSLMKHKVTAHPVPGQALKIQRDFICSFENCGLVFPSTKKLSWHQETHQRWPKRCEFCQERFVHKSNLVKHIRQKHDAQYLQGENGNKSCPICFKVFLKSSLRQHMRIHSGVKPYKCYMCNKKFRVKCNLDAHMFVHSGKRDRPYKCSLCVRSFTRDKDLAAHVRSHKNIRPFTCNECGKSFIHKNNLTAHIAMHSGRKEHTCMYCAKTFFRKYNLRNHERVHTGETPYSCPICGKAFTQKSNYNFHRKSFHVDRHAVHEEI